MTSSDLISQVNRSIAMLTDPKLASSELGLTNCDREPIHIPNAIQAHGVLLTFTQTDLKILQISQNCDVLLGRSAAAFLGQPLLVLMAPSQIAKIESCLNDDFENVNPLRLSLQVDGKSQGFEGILHRADGVIVLEIEQLAIAEDPAQADARTVNFFDFYKFVKAPMARIQNTQTLAELAQQTVTTIRTLTGFDRVMLYRFAEDGSGNVIAEAKADFLDSFLGLHYPASDIPRQAKELYRLNLLRIIPDASYTPSQLEPQLNPITGEPLDLSLSVLRSVSPMHTEYLANMGVQASMSISLLSAGGASPSDSRQLWGLIACHHDSPKQLSYETRTICEFLGQAISFEVGSKADAEDLDYKIQLQTAQARFINTIANCQSLGDGFAQNPDDLTALVGATGAVFCERSQVTAFGSTPPSASIADLITWIDTQIGEDAVFSTNTLVSEYPPMVPHKDVASGLLALRISRIQKTYLLWFRPEVLQTIDWGGQPNKPVEVEEDHTLRLTPRKSFDLWKETVQLKSLPWKPCEIEAALELRSRIIGIVLQKADELAVLNAELERSNIELDSFAYVASHDLKEPLRGIHNYSTFLIEDYGDKLGEDGTHKLATLMRLTQRMEDLIESLLHYSRCGRAELLFQSVNLAQVLDNVLDTIKIGHPSIAAEFELPRPLPVVKCDRTQLRELFTNLISNAIKYNDRDPKKIEIGYILPNESHDSVPADLDLDRSQTIFYVKDNGIGIRAKHLENIFKIFKRLHPANKYGGGTGAGLTIARKIVERHGGTLTVASTFGEGSTFYFTLGSRSRSVSLGGL
ncbi:ATP-binding protein [Chamaesiphon minutus]|uniref:histidine kinase n=1 Tax=Chamaesiphon minutus (strain ATCC 27169 / PCC 6605) TaxID=1173020 RepID=K9UL09_CHAP6|nr:ATP-binding protein [Chamaesiphon minutus]AFY94874.1 bacteriophytochrome (light-regulated signal transduction histidine kinase) [Chamaesiphon minutus PCC 6605]